MYDSAPVSGIVCSWVTKGFAHHFPTRHSHIRRIKGTFIAHCHDEKDGYAELNLKEDKPGWQKAKPVDRVYVKYDPKNNLPTQEVTLPNHKEKEVKALASAVCGTTKANQNLTYSLAWSINTHPPENISD